MKRRRENKLLVEPPSSASGDIAFNLIVFFLVCASVQPDAGRRQDLPRSEETKKEQKETENIEVQLTRQTAMINGDVVREDQFAARLQGLLKGRPRQQDRVVIVKSKPDTPYFHWIHFTELIEDAGGVITIQTEEEQRILLPN